MAPRKTDWLGTLDKSRRKIEREEVERAIDYLEQTYTPMTSHKLKHERVAEHDTPDDPARH